MENIQEILKALSKEDLDGLIFKTIAATDVDIHYSQKDGKGEMELSGHPATIMVVLERGVADTISGIAKSGHLDLTKKELFENFVKGVREDLKL